MNPSELFSRNKSGSDLLNNFISPEPAYKVASEKISYLDMCASTKYQTRLTPNPPTTLKTTTPNPNPNSHQTYKNPKIPYKSAPNSPHKTHSATPNTHISQSPNPPPIPNNHITPSLTQHEKTLKHQEQVLLTNEYQKLANQYLTLGREQFGTDKIKKILILYFGRVKAIKSMDRFELAGFYDMKKK